MAKLHNLIVAALIDGRWDDFPEGGEFSLTRENVELAAESGATEVRIRRPDGSETPWSVADLLKRIK